MIMKFVIAASLALLLAGCSTSTAVHGPLPEEKALVPSVQNTEEAFVQESIDAFLFDGDLLPDVTPEGTLIEWTVTHGHAAVKNSVITKTDGALEYEPIGLSASYGDETVSFHSLTLGDPAVAYVISYFTSEGTNKEQLKLAYTFNGEYWFKINEDKGILKPSSGTKRLRDPSLVRKPGGEFALLATQGYDTDSIYVYDSRDLITYENERALLLNVSNDGSMSGKQAWAPEAFFDPYLGCYVILWSSPSDGGIFCSTSKDLVTASYPKKLMDPGYPVIDITAVHTASGWTAILKDEREPMEDYSQVLRGTGIAWYAIDQFSQPIYDRHQVEGPMILKSLENENWYLVLDDYTRSAYKMLKTSDIETGAFTELEDTDLMIPLEKPSHGHAIRVTWNELERLTQAYENK